jgi:hypothetical protein
MLYNAATRRKILDLLARRPFQPFCLVLSNGNFYVVRHPDQAMVARTYMVVGITPDGAPGAEVSDTAFISLDHVTEAVPLESGTAA